MIEQSAKDATQLAVNALSRALTIRRDLPKFLDHLDTAAKEIGCAVAIRTTRPKDSDLDRWPALRFLQAVENETQGKIPRDLRASRIKMTLQEQKEPEPLGIGERKLPTGQTESLVNRLRFIKDFLIDEDSKTSGLQGLSGANAMRELDELIKDVAFPGSK